MAGMLAIARPRSGERLVADQTFGERLKQLREAAGLTQVELADRAGVNQFTIANLEADKYGPSLATTKAIAKQLGVTLSAFEDTVEPPPKEQRKAKPRPKGRPPKKPPSGEKPPVDQGEAGKGDKGE